MSKVHIGKLIRKRLDEVGMTKTEFARRINKSAQNVYDIFERTSIDTDLLQTISETLDHDFFKYYSKSYQDLISKWESESKIMKELNDLLEKYKKDERND